MAAKYEVDINSRLCKGCRICVEYCPQQVLELSPGGKVGVAQAEKCIGCQLCEMYCPDFALTIKEANCDE